MVTILLTKYEYGIVRCRVKVKDGVIMMYIVHGKTAITHRNQ